MKTELIGRSLAVVALCSAAMTANADTVSVQWLGFAAGSQDVKVGKTNAGTDVSAAAGAFNVMIGTSTFLTYCVELTQYASKSVLPYKLVDGVSYFSENYDPTLAVTGATVVNRIGRLFTYLGGMNTPTAVQGYLAAEVSAGIQLAVWESVYEGDYALSVSSTQDNTTNKFMAVAAPANVVAYANSILNGAANVTNQYSVSVVQYGIQPDTNKAQDYILLQRVPEPGSLALAALALGGLGLVSRRRRA